MSWYWEARIILGIMLVLALFLSISSTAGRTAGLAAMLFIVFMFNVYSFFIHHFIDEFWIIALIVFGLYFIIRFWKGDFKNLSRKDALTGDDE